MKTSVLPLLGPPEASSTRQVVNEEHESALLSGKGLGLQGEPDGAVCEEELASLRLSRVTVRGSGATLC